MEPNIIVECDHVNSAIIYRLHSKTWLIIDFEIITASVAHYCFKNLIIKIIREYFENSKI